MRREQSEEFVERWLSAANQLNAANQLSADHFDSYDEPSSLDNRCPG
jgi:hypothetical protein